MSEQTKRRTEMKNTKKPVKKITVQKVDKEKVQSTASKMAKKAKPKKTEDTTSQYGDPVKPETLISTLAQSAVLIKATCKCWSGTQSDKDWAGILAGTAGGAKDSFSVSLKILPSTMRRELSRRIGRVNALVKNNTLPFQDGWHLCATSIYVELKQALETEIASCRDFVDEIASRRDEIVEFAKLHLGKAYNEKRVPSADQIRKAFQPDIAKGNISIPEKLNGIEGADMEDLREELMANIHRKYNIGVVEMIDSLRETMERLIEELENGEDKDVKKYARTLDMCESRIKNIIRLDVFKSNRIRAALDDIYTNVLEPLRDDIKLIKKETNKEKKKALEEKSGKTKKQMASKVKQKVSALENLTI